MQLHRFDLNLLKSLDALLAEKNVTRAAQRVFLSQPAMSGALKRLRDEFNDQLLVRSGREMELTPFAQELLVSVRGLLDSVQKILDTKLTFDPSTARLSFNFAMTDYASMVLLPNVLDRLVVEAPYISCHVQTVDDSTYEGIIGGDIDLYVGIREWAEQYEARSGGCLLFEPLFSDDFVCMVAEDHPQIRDGMTIEQYCELPHSIVRFRRQAESIVESSWRNAGLDPRIGVTAPNFATLVLMLPHTKLIATVPRRIATALSRTLRVKIVECPVRLARLEEVLVWHPRASHGPAHDYIRSILFASANQVMGEDDNKSAG
jgi:LysR family nod box-dependent transcriptional activator